MKLKKVQAPKQVFDETKIVEMYNSGKDTVQIAKEFNSYNTSIRRVLIRNNVKIRDNSESKRYIKENPFLNLESDEVCYWIGYLIADGNIADERNRINISTVKDPEHLEKYRNFLGNRVSMSKTLNKKYNVYEYAVNFNHKEVKEYFISLGIKPRKSLDIKLNIPLNFSILRGIIDGDGHVKVINNGTTVHIAIASSYLRDQIIEFLKENNIKCTYTVDKRGNTMYSINICTQSEIEKLFFNLYNNASVFLERKYRNYGCLCKKLHKV